MEASLQGVKYTELAEQPPMHARPLLVKWNSQHLQQKLGEGPHAHLRTRLEHTNCSIRLPAPMGRGDDPWSYEGCTGKREWGCRPNKPRHTASLTALYTAATSDVDTSQCGDTAAADSDRQAPRDENDSVQCLTRVSFPLTHMNLPAVTCQPQHASCTPTALSRQQRGLR